MQHRRAFLATLGLAAIDVATGRACAALDAPRRMDRIGLQLYTVRDLMRRDVAGTLEQVAAIGYREVEFAGYFDRSPAELRAVLDRLGLAAPSAHIPLANIEGDRWRAALDAGTTLGHRYLTVPWLPEQDRTTVDAWKRVAARFNQAAREAKAAGLRFAYHNHDFEFQRVGGVVPFDVLLAETDPALVDFELDLYWIVRGGHDPLAYVAAHRGRFTMVHVKDSEGPPEHRMVDVGSGRIDFRTILPAFAEAGTRHFFVEHDQPADPLASIRASYNHLASL